MGLIMYYDSVHDSLNSWSILDFQVPFDVCQSHGKDSTNSALDLSVTGHPWSMWTNQGDTNCTPFDISISTAGCAAMRCRWKVPLRRAQIRHAIGRLCPGSVPLTQLPQDCCVVWGSVCWSTQLTASRTVCCDLQSTTWPSTLWQPDGTLISDSSRVFAFMAGNMPNSLFTSASSASQKHWMNPDASSWG